MLRTVSAGPTIVLPGSVGLRTEAPITPAGMPSSSITSDTMPLGSPSAMKRSTMPAGGRGTDIMRICSAAMRPVSCLACVLASLALSLALSLVFMGVSLGIFPNDPSVCHRPPPGPAFGRPDDKLRRTIQ